MSSRSGTTYIAGCGIVLAGSGGAATTSRIAAVSPDDESAARDLRVGVGEFDAILDWDVLGGGEGGGECYDEQEENG